MKSGASDPFADDGDQQGEGDEQRENESEPRGADGTDATDSTNDDGDDNAIDAASSGDKSETDSATESGPTISKADLPLLLRRETVKAERENVHQLFVQDNTDTRARQAENELSERLDTDVYRLDAREAIYLAGMKNLADAEEILVEWGYNF